MKKASGRPNNDKNIFNSVVSLMKAQAYELNALPNRKTTPCVYQFNLLSVVDSRLLRADFDVDDLATTEVEEELYVAGYIVNKQQTTCRIHFVRFEAFDELIEEYNSLHEANLYSFEQLSDSFYDNVFSSHERWRLIYDDFLGSFRWKAYVRLSKLIGEKQESPFERAWFRMNKSSGVLEYELKVEEHEAPVLNGDKEFRDIIAEGLRKYYRYEADFVIKHDEIPF